MTSMLRWFALSGVFVLVLSIAGGARAEGEGKAAKKQAGKTALLTLKITELGKATKLADIRKLEKGVKKVKGVTFAAASRKTGQLAVRHKPKADVAAIKAAIVKAGFTVAEDAEAAPAADAPEAAAEETEDAEE